MEAFYYKTDNRPTIPLDQKNLKFAFQPIIEAESGNIFGYEAFMRPNNYSPIEVIESYRSANQLQAVEEATYLCGIQAFLDANLEGFLFLNTFPGENMPVATARAIAESVGDQIKDRLVVELIDYTGANPLGWSMKRRSLITTEIAPKFAISNFGTDKKVDFQFLKMYQPDIVKISQKHISDIDHDPKKQKMVSNMVDNIHSRGMKAIAEGVETEGEYNCLRSLGMDYLQGYYVGEPTIY